MQATNWKMFVQLRIVVVVAVAAFGQSLAINQAAQYDRRRLVSESQSPSPSSDLPGDCDWQPYESQDLDQQQQDQQQQQQQERVPAERQIDPR